MTAPPPQRLLASLLHGPSRITGFDWHPSVTSTNALAAQAAARGAPEWHVVAADVQTRGRGRAGRAWTAPSGTSLLLSVVLRPPVPTSRLPLLPLLVGMAVAEVVDGYVRRVPGGRSGLKWPNDVLVRGGASPRPAGRPGAGWGKVAGILVEIPQPDAAVVGIGCNVDWRGAGTPTVADGGFPPASLSEVTGAGVDRWAVMAALLGVLGNRYDRWCQRPEMFLDGYRSRCVTIGEEVRVTRIGAATLEGIAVGVAGDGALHVRDRAGRLVAVTAGDVAHVRPAATAP